MSEQPHALEADLVARYEHLDTEHCPWGQKNKEPKPPVFQAQPAPVPFVGKDYGKPGKRILIYGSAETPSKGKTLDRLRHRLHDELDGRKGHFRQVHIEPISNGGLLTVARYLLKKLADQRYPGYAECEFSRNPREFIAEIAVANFGKWSLERSNNQDYANRGPILEHSVPYVAADLELLKPNLLILPHKIYQQLGKRRREPLFEDHGELIIVSCHQFADLNRARLEGLAANHDRAWDSWLEDDWVSRCKPGAKADLLRDYLKWMSSWPRLPDKDYLRLNPHEDTKTHAFWSSHRTWSKAKA